MIFFPGEGHRPIGMELSWLKYTFGPHATRVRVNEKLWTHATCVRGRRNNIEGSTKLFGAATPRSLLPRQHHSCARRRIHLGAFAARERGTNYSNSRARRTWA